MKISPIASELVNDVVDNDTWQSHIPKPYMEPSEYILHANKKYECVATWIDITSIQGKKHASKNKNVNCMTQSGKEDVTAILFIPAS